MAKNQPKPAEDSPALPLRPLEEAVAAKVAEIEARNAGEKEAHKSAHTLRERRIEEFRIAALDRIKREYRVAVELPADRIGVEAYKDRNDLFMISILFDNGYVTLSKHFSITAIARPENMIHWVGVYDVDDPDSSPETDFISAVTFATTGKG